MHFLIFMYLSSYKRGFGPWLHLLEYRYINNTNGCMFSTSALRVHRVVDARLFLYVLSSVISAASLCLNQELSWCSSVRTHGTWRSRPSTSRCGFTPTYRRGARRTIWWLLHLRYNTHSRICEELYWIHMRRSENNRNLLFHSQNQYWLK